MSAVVTIGFVKVAKHHIDVQGFNVYHKNRLIKVSFSFLLCCLCSCQISLTKLYPTYYVTYFGSDGRGVIGILFLIGRSIICDLSFNVKSNT